MILYGLFEYSYDYYEWENLICASEDIGKLREYYENIRFKYHILINEKEHKIYNKRGTGHYLIKKIKVIWGKKWNVLSVRLNTIFLTAIMLVAATLMLV